MSSECSSFIVLQSEPPSPLISILYFLPKDQTLKRAIKATKESPYIVEHFSRTDNTKSIRLSVIPEDRSSASPSLVIERPCSVITHMLGSLCLVDFFYLLP